MSFLFKTINSKGIFFYFDKYDEFSKIFSKSSSIIFVGLFNKNLKNKLPVSQINELVW